MASSGGLLFVLNRYSKIRPTRSWMGLVSRDYTSPWREQESDGQNRYFDKILVANRAEIACRVMRTAHRLGIETVAVYSEADKNSMHVAMAKEAHCIGSAPSSDSYLRMDRIIDVAKKTGSQAIHPGYGFLSENKNFAALCKDEGIEFIGPSPSAIEKMGVKRVSKEIMSTSSVPVVPGYFGKDQSNENLQLEADKIGYPVLIKADLGGGGKGMRIVNEREEFNMMLEACRSEALKSFNDDKVLLEKYLSKPRHVEVQVIGDKHGNILHLFERDCSVQRRHQKIIEEAPGPNISQSTRESIWSAAVRAAKAVDYVGAGTVEFIVDTQDETFYFMEMNTRLQVEHPITELITGTDLVELQLRVAAGHPLPLSQSDITCTGHAFEARIYAENPSESFSPSPGLLRHLATPSSSETVRIDTGVRQGDEVTAYYDPMIAKLVVWGPTRTLALNKLVQSLHNYQIVGVHSNLSFLTSLASHQSFIDADVHTGFIEQHRESLFPSNKGLSPRQQKLGILIMLALERYNNTRNLSLDPFNSTDGGRVNTMHHRKVSLKGKDEIFTGSVEYIGSDDFNISMDNSQWIPCSGQVRQKAGGLVFNGFIDNEKASADVVTTENTIHCFTNDGNSFSVEFPMPEYYNKSSSGDVGGVKSPPYSTRVNKVLVNVGDNVKKGQLLLTVEGMKMETNILSPIDGVVTEVLYNVEDVVAANSKVVEIIND
ncbi:PREDICTED: methylcrotonoyl-CoA carboxylase subunit alpha, mitochondrial [Amphimedon queenslandica]|uniref:Methylcrotonoyl-CoA carboxylase subunit alpha, mitochondrial n=1 Tax=Amphimedon queenslandica TaxID=400682 RepID=A0A1X7UEB3_AMPQE|nr:PREDICTED: methylcrotonoyl-CoA carboxylase subunit alpha, mitochondrial [Amphimedon queenslandica]|eukprot:XP_019854923.1 PREDICTED: methylcrotonoyl-CoA carboxylase subunit alpha, mitochondrial [Amphimedon queenslandica]